jgi:MraZ protein
MFFGEYTRHLDSKGRIMIPAEFREEIGDTIYVIIGFDKNLMLLQPKDFEKFRRYFSSLNIMDPDVRIMRRLFMSKAKQLPLDASNRIRIPSDLLELIGFEPGSSVVMAGNDSYLEIWTEQRWAEFNRSLMEGELSQERFAKFTIIFNDSPTDEDQPALF